MGLLLMTPSSLTALFNSTCRTPQHHHHLCVLLAEKTSADTGQLKEKTLDNERKKKEFTENNVCKIWPAVQSLRD